MTVAQFAPYWKPSHSAGVLLVARKLAPALTEGWTLDAILAATGAARSQAYAMVPRVVAACSQVGRPTGRPARPSGGDALLECAYRVRDYLIDHPGAVAGRGQRRRYTDAFRRFVLALAEPDAAGHGLTVEQLADATGVALGTLKDWRCVPTDAAAEPPGGDVSAIDATAGCGLADGAPTQGALVDSAPTEGVLVEGAPTEGVASDDPTATDATAADATAADAANAATLADESGAWADLAGNPQIATLLHAWNHWEGNFTAFCDHVRDHHRLPWGRTFISRLLEAAGLRQPRRRNARRTTWSRESFRRQFPGAQWLGDGTTLAIQLDGQRHIFNLEAVLDVDSNATVGMHVGDVEDEQAVRQAFLHGEATTGERPIALTLDGKACNHTDALAEDLDPTIVVPATPGRGQAKAPLEGAFGLFQQTAPPLVVQGNGDRERARSILTLVMLVWFWARNTKPRKRLDGCSPAEHYQQHPPPTPEQRDAARAWAAELRRRYDRFRETCRRRSDPARRALLCQALQDLGIQDPEDRLAFDLACYCTDAILFGIALLRSKMHDGLLSGIQYPDRYLAAVIRNKNNELELERTAQYLLELRLRHRDLTIEPLQRELDQLRATLPPEECPRALLDRALQAHRLIDFRFYAQALHRALEELDPSTARALYPRLTRRVAASHDVERPRRERLIAILAHAVTQQAA